MAALPLTIPHAAQLAAERWGDAPAVLERGEVVGLDLQLLER